MSDLQDLGAVRATVLEKVTAAAARAGRLPSDVVVVAVTKTVSAERIRAAFAAGFRQFGENRVQERESKAEALRDLGGAGYADGGATWHLVGPLQSNKASRAARSFDVIETVDSLELVRRLDRIAGEIRPGRPLPVLLQVNVDDDAAKAGFDPSALDRDLPAILELTNLVAGGLMTVGRLVASPEAARPTFVALRRLSEQLRARHARLGAALSMGMSDDYEVAVEEGATLVRLGRAIFGERQALR